MVDNRLIDAQLGPIDNLWIDANGCVAGDIYCRYCRYDLRTLPVKGTCPECGRSVLDSEPLYHRPLAWLRRLRGGIALLPLSMLVGLLGATAVSSVGGQWPRSVGETWSPDIWFYGVAWLGMTLPGLVWLVGILLLTTRSISDRLPFRRSLRLLLILYTPIWIWSATAEALSGRISLEVGRALGLVGSILWGAITCFVLICVGELMWRVPRRRLAQSASVLVCLTIPICAVGSFWSAISLFQTIGPEPSPPYAYATPPVDARGQPIVTIGPTTTHYMVVDASGAMTRTTTVPASMLAQSGQRSRGWVDDLTEGAAPLIGLMLAPMYAYAVAKFAFFALALWHLDRAVTRHLKLDAV